MSALLDAAPGALARVLAHYAELPGETRERVDQILASLVLVAAPLSDPPRAPGTAVAALVDDVLDHVRATGKGASISLDLSGRTFSAAVFVGQELAAIDTARTAARAAVRARDAFAAWRDDNDLAPALEASLHAAANDAADTIPAPAPEMGFAS